MFLSTFIKCLIGNYDNYKDYGKVPTRLQI